MPHGPKFPLISSRTSNPGTHTVAVCHHCYVLMQNNICGVIVFSISCQVVSKFVLMSTMVAIVCYWYALVLVSFVEFPSPRG